MYNTAKKKVTEMTSQTNPEVSFIGYGTDSMIYIPIPMERRTENTNFQLQEC